MILLSEKNLHTRRLSKKFEDKYYRLFKITDTWGKQVYKLKLPVNFHIHDMFHVRLLKKAQSGTRDLTELSSIMITNEQNEHEEFEVNEVLDSKYFRRHLKYLIRWTEYRNLTWEPAEVILKNVSNLVKAFHISYLFKLWP